MSSWLVDNLNRNCDHDSIWSLEGLRNRTISCFCSSCKKILTTEMLGYNIVCATCINYNFNDGYYTENEIYKELKNAPYDFCSSCRTFKSQFMLEKLDRMESKIEEILCSIRNK